jgi:RNA polymerase sigma factor (TIGR02999 family)
MVVYRFSDAARAEEDIPSCTLGSLLTQTGTLRASVEPVCAAQEPAAAAAFMINVRSLMYLTSANVSETSGLNPPRYNKFFQGASMAGTEPEEITGLLKAWGTGDRAALDRLTPLVYDELRRIARRYMRSEQTGNTLQATALVNEVYLRLVDVKNVDWEHRAQFFALSAQMMRRILVDTARARGSRKRGGDVEKVNVDEVAVVSPQFEDSIVAVDALLEELAKVAPRQAKVVELRFFGGLSVAETAEVMKLSLRSTERDWLFARSWLMRELKR